MVRTCAHYDRLRGIDLRTVDDARLDGWTVIRLHFNIFDIADNGKARQVDSGVSVGPHRIATPVAAGIAIHVGSKRDIACIYRTTGRCECIDCRPQRRSCLNVRPSEDVDVKAVALDHRSRHHCRGNLYVSAVRGHVCVLAEICCDILERSRFALDEIDVGSRHDRGKRDVCFHRRVEDGVHIDVAARRGDRRVKRRTLRRCRTDKRLDLRRVGRVEYEIRPVHERH